MNAPPQYPCCPCSETGSDNSTQHPPGDPLHYASCTTYTWHSGIWDLRTGRWRVVCHRGHVKKGRHRAA